ncbi:MAG TPA: methyltransferase MtaB domain-containing protein [Bryobacteraceae bacterium]|nr:hypothetical protein [Bryobacterales bacterium]HRJ17894.1 methyltransferase MtaB domain-containing protein [Bryobacteraceae bacterium]
MNPAIVNFEELAIARDPDLVFGVSPRPVSCGFGLEIGAGVVYPEVNFTLPAIEITAERWAEIRRHYQEIGTGVARRAVALQAPGIVLEFELLPAMTETPEWGAEITSLLHGILRAAHEKHGLRSALRVTPTDIRDQAKPPLLRKGTACDAMWTCFELCAEAGADILSIESVGAKELHDHGLLYGDVPAIAAALGVLAPRDMTWLWDHIVRIARQTNGVVPGGDTACGFANTAMQLAHQKMLPEVLAAVVRAMSAARSLVAFERGALGPSKDCAYEGPILKAITGAPISMEGKSACCAHFSPVGNIAAAMCDLWSNESVQNIRLLSGNAPEAFAELLVYDCRLMNESARDNRQLVLRDWLVSSDESLSPQAALLTPEATLRVARAIVSEPDPYRRTIAAGRTAVEILRERQDSGRLELKTKEAAWLERLRRELEALPDSEEALLAQLSDEQRALFLPASYGL